MATERPLVRASNALSSALDVLRRHMHEEHCALAIVDIGAAFEALVEASAREVAALNGLHAISVSVEDLVTCVTRVSKELQ